MRKNFRGQDFAASSFTAIGCGDILANSVMHLMQHCAVYGADERGFSNGSQPACSDPRHQCCPRLPSFPWFSVLLHRPGVMHDTEKNVWGWCSP